jgi:hypothetical protein
MAVKWKRLLSERYPELSALADMWDSVGTPTAESSKDKEKKKRKEKRKQVCPENSEGREKKRTRCSE